MPPRPLILPPRNTQHWVEPPLPKAIVLDGSEIVKPFYEKVKNLPVAPTVFFDNTDMLNSILATLAYEAGAQTLLEFDVLDMVSEMAGSVWGADVEVVAYGMVEFGQRLMQALQYMRAYRNGFLHFQHGQWMGTDIILHRIEPPSLQPYNAARQWFFTPPPQHVPMSPTRQPAVYSVSDEVPQPQPVIYTY